MGKKNKASETPESPVFTEQQLASLRKSVKGLLKTTSKHSSLTQTAICQILFGNQNACYHQVTDLLITQAKQEFLDKRWVVVTIPASEDREENIYVQSPRVKKGKAAWKADEETKKTLIPGYDIESQDQLLSPLGEHLLICRIALLRNQFRQLGINIDTNNPLIEPYIKDKNRLTELSPQQISELLALSLTRVHMILDPEQMDKFLPEQSPECQWLIRACMVADVYYRKHDQNFIEQLYPYKEDVSHLEFLDYLFDKNGSSSSSEVVCENQPIPACGEINFATAAPANPVDSLPGEGAADFETIDRQAHNESLIQRKDEELKKLDPELDDHLKELWGQLGIRNSHKVKFLVPQITRQFGIYPMLLRRWEDENKFIRRTSARSKRDQRHPAFDVTETLLIGYLVHNYVPNMSRDISSSLRRYISKYLEGLQQTSS